MCAEASNVANEAKERRRLRTAAEVNGENPTVSIRCLLLSVAVFAGLSGRLDPLGLVLVYLLVSPPKSLSGCSSGFALGKTSWKEKLD